MRLGVSLSCLMSQTLSWPIELVVITSDCFTNMAALIVQLSALSESGENMRSVKNLSFENRQPSISWDWSTHNVCPIYEEQHIKTCVVIQYPEYSLEHWIDIKHDHSPIDLDNFRASTSMILIRPSSPPLTTWSPFHVWTHVLGHWAPDGCLCTLDHVVIWANVWNGARWYKY